MFPNELLQRDSLCMIDLLRRCHFVGGQGMDFSYPVLPICGILDTFQHWANDVLLGYVWPPTLEASYRSSLVSHHHRAGRQEKMLLLKGLRKIYCPLDCLELLEKFSRWRDKSGFLRFVQMFSYFTSFFFRITPITDLWIMSPDPGLGAQIPS